MAVPGVTWHTDAMDTTMIKLDPQGRLVIPKSLRERLGFERGTELHAWAEHGRLVLETREAVIARMREEARRVDPERNMVDELIADRRAEAAREHSD